MEFDSNKQTLTVYGKAERISVLANRFQALSGKQTYEFFSERAVFLPRKLNVLALRCVLNERIKTLRASELPKEYYEGLENYRNFSEYQLFNLFATICDNKEDFKAYRLALWKLILVNYEALALTDGEINYLKNISKLQTEKLEKYFQYITSASREMENTFDGLEKDSLKAGLLASASAEDVIDLGAKYGIELPLEFEIDGFKAALKEYLAAFDKLNMEMDSYIDKASDMTLENFAIKNKIPLSFNMDKIKLVNYLFFILSIAEMPTTSVQQVVIPNEYQPLEFKVDTINTFNGDEPIDSKRVIYYAGCEEDGLFNEEEEIVEEVVEEEVQEEVVEEAQEEAKEKPEEESQKEEALAPVEDAEPEEDLYDDGQTAASLLARAKEGFRNQEKKEKRELSFGDVELNPLYGNPKVRKYYSGPAKMIALIVLVMVLAALGVGIALKYAAVI